MYQKIKIFSMRRTYFLHLAAFLLTVYTYLSITDFGSVIYIYYLAFFSLALYIIFYFNRLGFVKKSPILKLVYVWFFWMLINCVIYPSELLTNTLSIFFQTTLWCTLFFVIYSFTSRNPKKLLRKSKKYFYFLMLFLGMVYLNTNIETRNVYFSYYALAAVPWVLLYKNKFLKYFGLLFILIVVLSASKRGGFLAIAGSVTSYLYINNIAYKKNKGLGIVFFVISILLLSTLTIQFIDSFGTDLLTRINNMSEDEGSGRLDLYLELIVLINDFDLFQFIVGNGHDSTSSITGNFAHNEFLQFLVDYGLIGLIIYIYLHITLIKKCYKLFKDKSPYGPSFVASYIIFITIAMVSHWFVMPLFIVIIVSFWAVIFALTNQKVNLNNALKHKNN